MPLDRAILWVPEPAGATPTGAEAGPAVFIEHEVLAELNRHLAGAESRFGFLFGRTFLCPESEKEYVVADAVVAARESLAEEASGASLVRAWRESQEGRSGLEGLLLGWYHSHQRIGFMPTEADADTSRRYFSAAWQFAVIVATDQSRPLGGLFRLGSTDARQASRPVSFYELFRHPVGAADRSASAVAWSNYSETGRDRASATSAGSEPPAPQKSAAPSAPETSTEGKPSAPSWLAPPLSERPPTDQPFGVPLVMPGEGQQTGLLPPRSRRIGWRVIAPALLALAAAVYFLGPDVNRSEPSLGRTPAVPATVPVQTPEPPTPELQRLLDDVEALTVAGERYGERATDFGAGRIGCVLLTTGYAAADAAYVRVATSFRALGTRPNSQATSAYESAGEEIAAVNNHFDGSGCPRP